MKQVYQRTHQDCGVAAVAMVAGVSYKIARKAFKNGRPDEKKNVGTTTLDLYYALKHLRIKSRWKLTQFRTQTPYDLESHAILKVSRSKKQNWHWVAYDAKQQKIVDPNRNARWKRLEPRGKYNKTCRITSYLKIIKS